MKRRFILFALGTGALLVSALKISHADETPPPEPAIHHTPLDRSQQYISRLLVRPIAWFDRFFMSPHEQIETNHSYLRVIGSYQWVNKKGWEFQPRLKVKLRLPGLQERLSLVISGEDTAAKPPLSTDPERVSATDLPIQTAQNQVALRYSAWEWVHARVDFDLGLESEARVEASARYSHRIPITEHTLGRFSFTGFWLDRTGFGTTTRINADRIFSPKILLGWDNRATEVTSRAGFEWFSNLHLDMAVSKKSGIVLATAAAGPTAPSTFVRSYRFGTVYRQNFYREWMFWEVEPAVEWALNDAGHRPGVPGVALRLEIQFRDLTIPIPRKN